MVQVTGEFFTSQEPRAPIKTLNSFRLADSAG